MRPFAGHTLHSGIDDALLRSLMELMDRAFAPEHGERWSAIQLQSMLLSPLAWLVTADHSDRPDTLAGFALARSVTDELEVMLLGVDPEVRRKGVGAKLMEIVEAEAKARDVRSIFVEVRENNPARQFYESIGFLTIGHRPDYYLTDNGTRVAAITMAKTL